MGEQRKGRKKIKQKIKEISKMKKVENLVGEERREKLANERKLRTEKKKEKKE